MSERIIPPHLLEMIGTKYGHTTIIGFKHTTYKNKSGYICYRLKALYRCDCGKEMLTYHYKLRLCCKECYYKFYIPPPPHKTHGLSGTEEYSSWAAMIKRCCKPDDPRSKHYYHRGITVCDRWLDKKDGFMNFLSDLGERPHPKHLYSIDRINNELGYYKENCRWTTIDIQLSNKRPLSEHKKICILCNKEYIAKHPSRSMYCSPKCAHKAYNLRINATRKKPIYTNICGICNNVFTTNIKTTKYCSDECQKIIHRINGRKADKKRREAKRIANKRKKQEGP